MPNARGQLGARGERIAREHLESKGYLILDTNFRCLWGEIDIVAQDEECLVFVEVRTRKSVEYGAPEESLSRRKRGRLIATAETYIQDHPKQSYPGLQEQWRIDLIAVRVDSRGAVSRVYHIENAIQMD